jgi:4'-phosphopantetheinyl transferase
MYLKLFQVDLSQSVTAELINLLSFEERRFAETMQNPALKSQHLKVRIAVRQILAVYLNQSAAKIRILKTAYGKPYLANYPDCQFNISHSGNTLLVAVGNVIALGIDIEQAKPHRRDFTGLVKKCFAEPEQTFWIQLPDCEKSAQFYRFWTRKEAFVKAVGRGVALGLQSCVIGGNEKPYFVSIPKDCGQATDWQLFDLTLAQPDLYSALAVKADKAVVLPDVSVFELT